MKRARQFLGRLLLLALLAGLAPFVLAQTLPADSAPAMNTTLSVESAPAMPGPSVSSVSVTDITDTSARVDVDSDEMVQGYVEYGTTEQYGMSTPLTSEFSTSPSFLLENLTPETLYHYRVIVMDSSGNAAITADETFTTFSVSEPEPEPPPPPPTDTSTSTSTNSTPSTGSTTLTASSSPQAGSEQAVSGQAATTTTTGSSGQATTTSPAPPIISNVSTAVSTSSVTITWTTSKPATSDIRYGTTTSYGFTIGKDSTLKTMHSRILNNLPASSLFHFRLVVADSSGNTGLGKDRTFTTSAAPSAPVSPPLAGDSTSSAETFTKIPEEGAQAAAAAPQGVGGFPVVPLRPLLLTVTPLDGQVAFDWRKDSGVKNGIIHTVIVKKQGTLPVQSRIDGEIIYDGPSTTFTDTNVENGKEYHYALYSYGAFGRFTAPARFKVIPQAGEEQVDLSSVEADDAPDLPISLTRDLSVGKRGDDVWRLQVFLAAHGYYPEALATGYFGRLTKAAVMRYQKLNNITPVAGYVGPLTREVLAQQ